MIDFYIFLVKEHPDYFDYKRRPYQSIKKIAPKIQVDNRGVSRVPPMSMIKRFLSLTDKRQQKNLHQSQSYHLHTFLHEPYNHMDYQR